MSGESGDVPSWETAISTALSLTSVLAPTAPGPDGATVVAASAPSANSAGNKHGNSGRNGDTPLHQMISPRDLRWNAKPPKKYTIARKNVEVVRLVKFCLA